MTDLVDTAVEYADGKDSGPRTKDGKDLEDNVSLPNINRQSKI